MVKQEEEEDEGNDAFTQLRQGIVHVKTEPSSPTDDLFFNAPTQERRSKETNIVLCGTYLQPQKKVRSIAYI